MGFDDDYSRAIASSNLKSKPDTVRSDSDVLGAAGLAGKREPLALALLRLFSGDNHASGAIVAEMSAMAWGKARTMGVKLRRTQADEMARMVLAWWRDGVCTACGGHGFQRIEGSPTLSEHACHVCRGTGKVLFEKQFAMERVLVAQWLLAEVQRDLSRAAPAARAALVERDEA